VELKADVELGGTDQLFNLNVGRDIMPEFGLAPQIVMTTPLLEGTDGVEKMSKSLENYIGVTEPPREILGKVMSISDDLMWRYYTLCTDLSVQEIEEIKKKVTTGEAHPRDVKVDLAVRIVSDFHDPEAARGAAEEFRRIFSGGEVPDEIPEVVLAAGSSVVEDDPAAGHVVILLPHLLEEQGLAKSRGAARRLLSQGAVRLGPEGVKIGDERLEVSRERLREGLLLKVGKRRFLRLKGGRS
jgi:tyrosyl-tRNA synthetase